MLKSCARATCGAARLLQAALFRAGEVALVVHADHLYGASIADLEERAAGEGDLILAVHAAGVVVLLLRLHARLKLLLGYPVIAHIQVWRSVRSYRRSIVAMQVGKKKCEEIGVRHHHNLSARSQLLVERLRPQP